MDLKSLLTGLHGIRDAEVGRFANRKSVALRSAYAALYGEDDSAHDFAGFVQTVPDSVLGIYFGSDGLDQHYTRLLGGLASGAQAFDSILTVTINYILGQLTYQGRYLAKHEPEPLVVAGGGKLLLEIALANAQKIESFKVGIYDEPDFELQARMAKLALNARPLVWGDPQLLATRVTTDLGRPLGCLAMLDIGLPDQCALPYSEVAAPLEQHFSPDTFHLFSGNAAKVFDIRQQLHSQFPAARFAHRSYGLDRAGAELTRSVLIATGIERLPTIKLDGLSQQYRFCAKGTDINLAEGMTTLFVRDDEIVPVQAPEDIASSAPLPQVQYDTITQPVVVNHSVKRVIGGRVIDASTIFAHSYIIATAAGQVFEEMHLAELIDNTAFGKPDPSGMINVSTKEVAYVRGPALLFSFSPGIVGYHSHFLLQCFPRVITAEHLGISDMRLLVPSTMRSYQFRMLEMAGWAASQLVVMDPDLDYVCDELYVPYIAPAIFSPFQSVIYDRLIKKIKPATNRPHRRIIISRAARTTWRNMVNYDAVCELLVRERGFEIVAPEKLSIEDEIKLFQSSAIVVGAEGAGLYNCCFMAPGTDVIVLADQDYVMYVVGSMAAIRKFDVSFVFGESIQADSDLVRRAGHADFVLDPHRVEKMVDDVIYRKQLSMSGEQ